MNSLFKLFGKKYVFFLIFTVLFSSVVKADFIGAGATFPYPLYKRLFLKYYKENHVKINYQSIGSGGGIRQLKNKTVDFGATDAFVDNVNLKQFDEPILHIPICSGAIGLTYNIPGVTELRLTAGIIGDIFQGKIKKWNHEKIKAINNNIKLPNLNIVTIHRSESSGTTYVFTEYLSKTNLNWKQSIGSGKIINWPVGVSAKGNAGVTSLIKQIPGAIGYISFEYAKENNLKVAFIRNKAGNYIQPSIESITQASNTFISDDTRINITNTDSIKGYPISTFSWIIVYENQSYKNRKRKKSEELIDFLNWMVTGAQNDMEKYNYAPLSIIAQKKAKILIEKIHYNEPKLTTY